MPDLTPGGIELGLKIIGGCDALDSSFGRCRWTEEDSPPSEEASGIDSQLTGYGFGRLAAFEPVLDGFAFESGIILTTWF